MISRYNYIKLASFILVSAIFISNSTGSPGGRTGSPGDGNLTCGVSNCHGAQTPTPIEMISSTIPLNGYKPDSTYTITVSPAKTGITKFGFEMVAEDDNGTAVGSFSSNTEVTAYLSNKHVTHKSTSTAANNTRTWNVQWKAPSAGTGSVTFYAASLASNANGNNFGDSVLIDNYTVNEDAAVVRITEQLPKAKMSCYPNPFKDKLHINYQPQHNCFIQFFDTNGKLVLETKFVPTPDISSLAKGRYTIKLLDGDFVQSLQLMKM